MNKFQVITDLTQIKGGYDIEKALWGDALLGLFGGLGKAPHS